MRVTQTMMTRQYTRRVSDTLGDLNYVNKQVGSGRKFFRASENPAGAAIAYQLRRQSSQVNDYLTNVKDAISTLDSKDGTITQITKAMQDIKVTLLGIKSGASNSPADQKIAAQQFRAVQETMVKDMNTKYGDKFMFGGGNVTEPPFELKGNILTYRGVDVTGNTSFTMPDGSIVDSMELLDQFSKDAVYTDLGFGLEFDNGELVTSSAFNGATPGINILGYGTDTNGTSNNVVVLLGQIATMLEDGDCTTEQLDPYLDKFNELEQTILNAHTKVGSDSMFLEYTQDRLEGMEDNLALKSSKVEFIDAEEAIMNLNTIDYMYQALLKTGKNILSNSFIDFMS